MLYSDIQNCNCVCVRMYLVCWKGFMVRVYGKKVLRGMFGRRQKVTG
jgi:hypothetical protein